MGKPDLNLKEPDQTLMWLKAFAARARVEKKKDIDIYLLSLSQQLGWDIDSTPGTSGPPAAVAAIAKDYQVTDFFRSQCVLEALIKLNGLVAPRYFEVMNFIEIRKDLIN